MYMDKLERGKQRVLIQKYKGINRKRASPNYNGNKRSKMVNREMGHRDNDS
ncbi:hypothetical protein [Bacillus sp. OK048]|uniref:hypothetical protein n=1 Tax=Bacillus sp. OK048 TaxID=1882761 RepID=UPI0015877593|nr:hypothetical protein [Bacillus sp. OK048]